MMPVTVTKGSGPIVLGLPHTGTFVPADVHANLNENGRKLADTDWHIDRLYDGLIPNVTTVTANFHRYVIDANRDPEGASLYPGQNTTTLVPLTDFDGLGIWETLPTEADIATRRRQFHTPYHNALTAELERVRALHGVAILYDCHSIRSDIPHLFEGILPDFNIGTNKGTTCAPIIQGLTERVTTSQGLAHGAQYTSVTNGRFKGGWTTRHYGKPSQNIHAIQMELALSTYLETEEPPWTYDAEKAFPIRTRLRQILQSLEGISISLGEQS